MVLRAVGVLDQLRELPHGPPDRLRQVTADGGVERAAIGGHLVTDRAGHVGDDALGPGTDQRGQRLGQLVPGLTRERHGL
jgi:hypothetical protein